MSAASTAGPARSPLTGQRLAECLTANALHLILLPTEGCNFRCTYCYESFEIGRMPRRVVDGVKNLLTRRAPSLSSLQITWFGGEPLLTRDIVEEIMEHARALARARPSLQIGSDMTTNGYFLTAEAWRRLIDLGVAHFQVSFDGPGPQHDRVRRLAGGGGTFDRVWSHLIAARDTSDEFTMLARLHVCPENEPTLAEFVDAFDAAFGKDRRFELFLRPLERLGGPNDDAIVFFERDEGRAAVDRLSRRARALGVPHRRIADLGGICYASRANSFVIRADGRVNKCTVALEDRRNQVGRIAADGSLEIDGARVAPWVRGLWSGEAGALACPLDGLAD
jgi:uncharacterized protein